MEDQDNRASDVAQETSKWSDLDYCTMNHQAHSLANDAIAQYWLGCNTGTLSVLDSEILRRIEDLVALAEKLRAHIGAKK